jgi:hypothetical protein
VHPESDEDVYILKQPAQEIDWPFLSSIMSGTILRALMWAGQRHICTPGCFTVLFHTVQAKSSKKYYFSQNKEPNICQANLKSCCDSKIGREFFCYCTPVAFVTTLIPRKETNPLPQFFCPTLGVLGTSHVKFDNSPFGCNRLK